MAPGVSPSDLIGLVVFWFIFLGALSIAISSLGIAALNEFVADVFNYLPNVVVAILIAVAAVPIAGALAKLAERTWGDSPMGKLMATAVKAQLTVGVGSGRTITVSAIGTISSTGRSAAAACA